MGALLPVAAAVSWRWLRRLDSTAVQPGPHLGLLRGVPSLRLASLGVLESLSRAVREVWLPAGAVVVREGDFGELFYVVAEGSVVVSQQGRELRRLGPGDSFGEIALLRDVPRTATVEVAERALLVTLARPDFLRVVGSSTSVRSAADAVVDDYLRSDSQAAPPAGDP
jgi:CRP-like cAMP-binding protein